MAGGDDWLQEAFVDDATLLPPSRPRSMLSAVPRSLGPQVDRLLPSPKRPIFPLPDRGKRR